VRALTASQKGAIAEAAVAAAAIRNGLTVLRPFVEGSRYDLVIDTGIQLLRVQCKWARRRGDVLHVRLQTSRRTKSGYARSAYSEAEIDALAAFAPETERCYLLPAAEVAGGTSVSLRLAPAMNGQLQRVRWARDYELQRSLARFWPIAERRREPRADLQVP
jgi:hypothetical protein